MRWKTSAAPPGGHLWSSFRRGAVAAAVAAAVVATALPANTADAAPARAWREVVVTGSDADAAAAAVTASGGRVLASLPLVRGVAARLPEGAVLSPEWLVAPQRELRVAAAPTPAAADGPTTTLRETLGLPADGNEGKGVTVAVVDTGIADVPDLAGRIAQRVDISGDGAGDGYGHGTFMAGMIAGSGAASGGAYRGVAPAAKLVDVKVADAEGRTDLITVLRGLEWVREHARDVRVVNLSLSSRSPLPYQIDPLTQALDALWRRGVTVVVPSGNDGPDPGSVTSPGTDPLLLTAGGLDESGTADRSDDSVAGWSGRGPTWQGDAKPDLVAPGAHVIGLRAPGSVVDTENPQARIGSDYFRGSGSSMATAVTSGVVAAVLARQPKLRPNAVKNLLTSTAYAAPGLTRAAGAGAGGLDARRALDAAPGWRSSAAEAQFNRDTAAIGRDAKRWAALERAFIEGDRAAAAKAWAKLTPASRDWAARAWVQLDPATRDWAARAWVTSGWGDGADGTAEEWAARAWVARAWVARAWVSDEWSARAWVGEDWSARAWVARAWVTHDWAARAWVADQWSARAWAWRP